MEAGKGRLQRKILPVMPPGLRFMRPERPVENAYIESFIRNIEIALIYKLPVFSGVRL